LNRINEITFNASLIKEIRSIKILKELIEAGISRTSCFRDALFHRINADEELKALERFQQAQHGMGLSEAPARRRLSHRRGTGWRKTLSMTWGSAPPWISTPCIWTGRAAIHVTGFVGIGLALALLMYLAYRGISVVIMRRSWPCWRCCSRGTPILGAYTQVFMTATGNFIILYFPLFLLGAIFGKLMDDSGSARPFRAMDGRKPSAEERSILVVVLSCALLTYGGVSLFVVAFAVYPIAEALFRENGIPKRLIPGAVALGAFTFTMTALPGTPAIQNAIPMPFFGTTPFAAPCGDHLRGHHVPSACCGSTGGRLRPQARGKATAIMPRRRRAPISGQNAQGTRRRGRLRYRELCEKPFPRAGPAFSRPWRPSSW
jgi:hypothetical protein